MAPCWAQGGRQWEGTIIVDVAIVHGWRLVVIGGEIVIAVGVAPRARMDSRHDEQEDEHSVGAEVFCSPFVARVRDSDNRLCSPWARFSSTYHAGQ
jgi:hypothetical protein